MAVMGVATRVAPSAENKLLQLASLAQYDLSCACGDNGPRTRSDKGLWIYPTALPSGARVPMLKVLQDAGCERGCTYCAQRHGGVDGGAMSLAPGELARQFDQLQRAGKVFGLFLSSAIRGGPVKSMDRLLATAEILRRRHRFRGYLHLKILPGSEPAQVDRAMHLATRVSVNLELPTAGHLARVAPAKKFRRHLLEPMLQVAHAEREGRYARSGQTTQFVVGAASESDHDIVKAASWLYGRLKLARVYYSGFQPLEGTPLAHRPAVPFMREHRLYQADFLLRKYGFSLDEIPFNPQRHLSLEEDPKTAWARANPQFFPVEVNRASPEELMRVPGIGPTSADRLVKMRLASRLRSTGALRAAGANWRVAAPYMLLDGRRAAAQQLELF